MSTPNDKAAKGKVDGSRQERTKVFWLLLIQVIIVIMMTTAGWFVRTDYAVSLLAGGTIGVSVSGWMALVLLRKGAAESPDKLLSALYIGELGKYLFVMAFFAIAFKKIVVVREPHNALLMIGAFATTQMVVWLWPLLIAKAIDWTEKKANF